MYKIVKNCGKTSIKEYYVGLVDLAFARKCASRKNRNEEALLAQQFIDRIIVVCYCDYCTVLQGLLFQYLLIVEELSGLEVQSPDAVSAIRVASNYQLPISMWWLCFPKLTPNFSQIC